MNRWSPCTCSWGLHLVPGIHDPLTPLGREVLAHLVLGVGRVFAYAMDPYLQTTLFEAGERLWINIAPLLRHPLGRRAFPPPLGRGGPAHRTAGTATAG